MSRIWKLVWLCLLALALPVQGLAAATMVHCGPSHERMHGALQPQAEHGSHEAAHQHQFQHQFQHQQPHHAAHTHGPTGETSPAHADPGHADLASAPAADTFAAAADTLSDLAQYQCSACGACCAAAVLPATAPHLPAIAPVALPAAERGPASVPYLTDGPERPPRTVLA